MITLTMHGRQDVRVRIFSDKQLKEVKVMIFSGTYQIQDSLGNTLHLFNKNDSLRIKPFDKGLVVFTSKDTLFFDEFFKLRGVGFLNILQIEVPGQKRLYDDHLIIKQHESGMLWLINEVELEHYVAGVVQAEAGIAKNSEFYKVQAVAVRTYTMKSLMKHAEEGYHLCDQTHCQVYKGRCANADIMLSTSKTAGEVMVDSSGNLITAVFHSNSGGQTANSEDVWSKPIPYLRSVSDQYSLGQPNATWKKSISKSEWLEYLRKNFEYPVHKPEEVAKVTNFNQDSRRAFLSEGISLRKIREDFGLKSTFFSISESGDQVVFQGKGFGHGVGMSQEGAMNMARQGFIYTDILKFYYLGISITTLDMINQ